MSDSRTLLVIEPTVKLSARVSKVLEESGFIVVRGDPNAFHIIGNHPPLSDPLVLSAALSAIGDYTGGVDNGNGIRSLFARRLATRLGYADAVKYK